MIRLLEKGTKATKCENCGVYILYEDSDIKEDCLKVLGTRFKIRFIKCPNCNFSTSTEEEH